MNSKRVFYIGVCLFALTFVLAVVSFALVVALLSGAKFKQLNVHSVKADSVSVADNIAANGPISTKGTLNAILINAKTIQASDNLSTGGDITADNVAAKGNVYAVNGVFGDTNGNGYVYSNNGNAGREAPYFGAVSTAKAAGYCWPGITSSNCVLPQK
jgi:hypothetical protein